MAWAKWTYSEIKSLSAKELFDWVNDTLKNLNILKGKGWSSKYNQYVNYSLKPLLENGNVYLSQDAHSGALKGSLWKRVTNKPLRDLYIADLKNNGFIWEHVVPTNMLISELTTNPVRLASPIELNRFITDYGSVCIVSTNENSSLNPSGTPITTFFTNPDEEFCRYAKNQGGAGIKIGGCLNIGSRITTGHVCINSCSKCNIVSCKIKQLRSKGVSI